MIERKKECRKTNKVLKNKYIRRKWYCSLLYSLCWKFTFHTYFYGFASHFDSAHHVYFQFSFAFFFIQFSFGSFIFTFFIQNFCEFWKSEKDEFKQAAEMDRFIEHHTKLKFIHIICKDYSGCINLYLFLWNLQNALDIR